MPVEGSYTLTANDCGWFPLLLSENWEGAWEVKPQVYNISMLLEYSTLRNQCGEMKSYLLFSSIPVNLSHEILSAMCFSAHITFLSDASMLHLCYLHQHCNLHQLCCLHQWLAWFARTVPKCWFVAKSTSHATELDSNLALVNVFMYRIFLRFGFTVICPQ